MFDDVRALRVGTLLNKFKLYLPRKFQQISEYLHNIIRFENLIFKIIAENIMKEHTVFMIKLVYLMNENNCNAI